MVDIDQRFDLIFEVGRSICSAYTGFTKMEVFYCQQKHNWLELRPFLMSNSIYEALMNFSMHPVADVVSYY